MTDAQLRAQNWLYRLQDYEQIYKAEKNTLETLHARLYGGVAKYDNTGRGASDPILSQAARNDALIAFSMQAEKMERAHAEYIKQLQITQSVIDKLPPQYRALATDKYINRKKQEELEEIYHYGHTRLTYFYGVILKNVAAILENKPEIIPQGKTRKKAAQSLPA